MQLKKGSKGEEVKELQKLLNLYVDGIFGDLTEEAVKEFQRNWGLIPDGIVGEKTLGYLKNNIKISTRNINEIIIHCSATQEGKDYTIDDIKRWHKERGFSDIGYHYVIYRDGKVLNGRDVNISGAHCTNHNAHSIGICYIGGLDKNNKAKDTRTEEQKKALKELLTKLRFFYPKAKIYGHRDFAAKDCPSFDAKNEFKNI